MITTKKEIENPILESVCGSRLYGLDTKMSDTDIRGIFIMPTNKVNSIKKFPEEYHWDESKDGGNDYTYWELEKVLKLSLQNNPNILDAVFSSLVLSSTEEGEFLRKNASRFLSKRIFYTYGGYAKTQLKKFLGSFEDKEPDWKNAMHVLRLYFSGIESLRQNKLLLNMEELGKRDFLLEVRRGEIEEKDFLLIAEELEKDLQKAQESTKLPESGDLDFFDKFLINMRRKF